MNMMYTLKEENYKEVLSKIQEMTNNYKMLHAGQYTTVKSGIRTEDEEYGEPDYRRESWGKRDVFKGIDKNGDPIISEEDFRDTCFVCVEEHIYKIYHDEDPSSFKGKEWEKRKPLIRMDLAPDYVIILKYGDKVKFEENGFSVYTDNEHTRFGKDLVVHQDTFIISQEDKITDLDSEIAHRDTEWGEYEDALYGEESTTEDYDSDEGDDYDNYGDYNSNNYDSNGNYDEYF